MNIEKEIKEIKEIMYGNTEKILKNMDRLHSHEEMINENTNKIQEQSYALEIVRDYKKENKRLYSIIKVLSSIIMILLVILALFVILTIK